MRDKYGRAAKYSQCGSKKRYRDEAHANRVRKWREGDGSARLRVYDCQFCSGFHLTKQADRDFVE